MRQVARARLKSNFDFAPSAVRDSLQRVPASSEDPIVTRVLDVEPDSLPDRTRFYRRNLGPSRWLLTVVSYEQDPARIITAVANRKDPKLWKR